MFFSKNTDGDVEIFFSGELDTKVSLEGVKAADLDRDGDGIRYLIRRGENTGGPGDSVSILRSSCFDEPSL